jgi:histidine triad (HIT) family protein
VSGGGGCPFCAIVRGDPGEHVYAADGVVGFLDHRPVFHGHVLLVPRTHIVTLDDLPAELMVPLLSAVQVIMAAQRTELGAEGTFVAANNVVSQSVAHLHVHVVPRRKGDGLRGFFWPRHPYDDEDERAEVRDRLRRAVDLITG